MSLANRNKPTGNPSEVENGCGCIFLALLIGLAVYAVNHWR